MNSAWLSILEYARYKNISISTIRRYIKAERVKTRMEGGKYHIFVPNYAGIDSSKNASVEANNNIEDLLRLKLENDSLKKSLLKLQDDISELKMLVAIYENKKMEVDKAPIQRDLPPELPNMM